MNSNNAAPSGNGGRSTATPASGTVGDPASSDPGAAQTPKACAARADLLSAEGRPPLESLASDTRRTHRTWTPKYGRVQKCDWCNDRSEGTLQVCGSCSVRICERCARNRVWSTDRTHFIDSSACDWAVKRVPKASAAKTRVKRPATSSPRGKSATPGSRRRKLAHDGSHIKEEDESVDGSPMTIDSAPVTDRTSAPVVDTQQAAAQALLSMKGRASQPADDRIQGRHNEENNGYAGGDGSVNASKGYVEDANDYRHHPGSDPVEDGNTDLYSPAHGGQGNNFSSAPDAMGHHPSHERPWTPPDNTEHDRMVVNVYDWTYGYRPYLDPHRVRTPIPGTWDSNWPAHASPYGRGSSHREYSAYHGASHQSAHYPAHAYDGHHRPYGQYGGEGQAGASHFSHHAPPPVPGYAPHPSHRYPEYPHDTSYQSPRPGESDYHAAPSRSPVPYRQYSEHNPAAAAHDRQMLAEMRHAWTHNPDLARLVAENRRVYAVGVLWDVFELRRASRVTAPLRDDLSQTVRWFIEERDCQARLERQPPPPPPPSSSWHDPPRGGYHRGYAAQVHTQPAQYHHPQPLYRERHYQREEEAYEDQYQRQRVHAPAAGAAPVAPMWIENSGGRVEADHRTPERCEADTRPQDHAMAVDGGDGAIGK